MVKKSKDTRFQLHVWSKLLEGRIALQKVVKTAEVGQPGDEVIKLLTCLVALRDTYRRKSQFCRQDEEDKEVDSYSNIDDEFLSEKHNQYSVVRSDIIEKWCKKTTIGTIPKKGYVALELPTLQLISNTLKDKERLIKRTQIDQTSNEINPEIFNDDDFYYQLLKEVISKEEKRKWVEIQRLKYKIKRKANTKGTKNRQIRKDLIPKLVNFMAPSRPANAVPDQIRNQLMKSLFGS